MAGSRYGVEVRAAAAADAAEVARLLGGPAAALAERLAVLRASPGNAVLVATGWNALSGVAAVHWQPALHLARPVAQLAVLLVDPADRRRGIGRMLLKAACQAARAAGCEAITLAPGTDDAAAFCQATGFTPGAALHTRALRRRADEAGVRPE